MLQFNYKSRKNFCMYLREIRIALKTNIKDTAELIGVLPHRLSDYERGKILPTEATLRKMTKAFEVCGVNQEALEKLKKLHAEAIAGSNNRVIGRIRSES